MKSSTQPEYSYSHSHFVKETYKLHVQSLKTLLQMPLATLNESVFTDNINDYFQSNWRSLVVLLSRSDIPYDQ